MMPIEKPSRRIITILGLFAHGIVPAISLAIIARVDIDVNIAY
jgi:hypothetical protein